MGLELEAQLNHLDVDDVEMELGASLVQDLHSRRAVASYLDEGVRWNEMPEGHEAVPDRQCLLERDVSCPIFELEEVMRLVSPCG